MANTNTVMEVFRYPTPVPIFDFIWTPVYTERTKIFNKVVGVSFAYTGGLFGNGSPTHSELAYFIFVSTERGNLRLSVSKKVFDLIQVGDSVVVNYRQGRWTKEALEGEIAN